MKLEDIENLDSGNRIEKLLQVSKQLVNDLLILHSKIVNSGYETLPLSDKVQYDIYSEYLNNYCVSDRITIEGKNHETLSKLKTVKLFNETTGKQWQYVEIPIDKIVKSYSYDADYYESITYYPVIISGLIPVGYENDGTKLSNNGTKMSLDSIKILISAEKFIPCKLKYAGEINQYCASENKQISSEEMEKQFMEMNHFDYDSKLPIFHTGKKYYNYFAIKYPNFKKAFMNMIKENIEEIIKTQLECQLAESRKCIKQKQKNIEIAKQNLTKAKEIYIKSVDNTNEEIQDLLYKTEHFDEMLKNNKQQTTSANEEQDK